MKNTDEEHQATTNELVEFLRKEDANVSRKTVKDDIDVLIEEGIDIVGHLRGASCGGEPHLWLDVLLFFLEYGPS
jgi:hypothetical protein